MPGHLLAFPTSYHFQEISITHRNHVSYLNQTIEWTAYLYRLYKTVQQKIYEAIDE